MPRASKSNVPQPLKWNIESAAREFGLAIGTLRKALNKNSTVPDADGLFTTQQVAAAIYGSMHIEKLATQREVRRKLEGANAITTGSVLDRAELAKVFGAIGDAMRSRIMACSEMSRTAKEDILHNLSTIPLALQEVADRQTRLPRNGKRLEEDQSES